MRYHRCYKLGNRLIGRTPVSKTVIPPEGGSLGSNPSFPTKFNILRDRLEKVPAQSHKLVYVGSSPTPASKKIDFCA